MASASDTIDTSASDEIVESTDETTIPETQTKNPDLDNLDENAKAIVEKLRKGFQSDYTKKLQTLAEERKEVEAKKADSDKWSKWYGENAGGIDEYTKWLSDKDSREAAETEDLDDVGKLDKKLGKRVSEVETNLTNTVNSLSDIYLDLMDIKVTDPAADTRKVLETARREGITDMRLAYNRTYEKRLTQKKIDEEVAKRLKEREDKDNIDVVNTRMSSGRSVLKVARKK